MVNPYGPDQIMFILLSLMISIMSSYTMFQFIGSIGPGDRTEWRNGMLGGAAVFGFGLLSLHFVTMLAWNYIVSLNWHMVLIFVMGGLLSSPSFLRLGGGSRMRIALSSAELSAGALAMHYVNMLSGPLSRFELNSGLFTLSAAVSFSGAWGALYWFDRSGGRSKLASGAMLGCSTVAMMMIGMEAVTVEYTQVMTTERLNRMLMGLVAIIGLGTLLVPAGGLAAWLISKRFNVMDERYKLLVENSMDMIAIFSNEKWEYVNGAGLRMFEAEHERELLGKSVFLYLHPKHHDAMRERLRGLERHSQNGPFEQDWFTVGGKLLHTEVVETATMLNGKPAVQMIVRDISERKKNEELLINSEKLYVAGQLAAGIAHEIRNPLTSLKGFLQLIASGRTVKDNYIHIMGSELNRIESIVSELLMLSKPQIYELTVMDVRTVMADTVTLLEAQAIMDNIVIELDAGDEPLLVQGVENQIKQVFINVIKNAIEAMSDGGNIYIRCMRDGEQVVVRIVDEGPGIDEAQLSKMGQPFYTTKERGTGLGLMVSYKIVDNHQGSIGVSSQLGIGTTIDITFPYANKEREADDPHTIRVVR